MKPHGTNFPVENYYNSDKQTINTISFFLMYIRATYKNNSQAIGFLQQLPLHIIMKIEN